MLEVRELTLKYDADDGATARPPERSVQSSAKRLYFARSEAECPYFERGLQRQRRCLRR